MAREASRVDPQFLQDQKIRRDATANSPGNENSIIALRERVDNLEKLLSVRPA